MIFNAEYINLKENLVKPVRRMIDAQVASSVEVV